MPPPIASNMRNFIGRYLGYALVDTAEDAAMVESRQTFERRVSERLDALYEHSRRYCVLLDELAKRLDGIAEDGEVHQATQVLEEYEALRKEHWLAFWLVFIDDDASDIEVIPTTLEEVVALVKANRVRFRKLDEPRDELRRQCAMLTAQIYEKHRVLAWRWGLEEIQVSLF